MRTTTAQTLWLLWLTVPGSMAVAQPPSSGSIPGDCDNNGFVDLTDFAGFTLAAQGPDCAGSGNCRCYDLNADGCVNLADFAALQVAFGTAQDSSGPPPSNLFVSQLADYHDRCTADDGGDGACHVGDPCCQTQVGPPETPCDVFQGQWVQVCDRDSDGERDLRANLDTLAEWNDFLWEPDDACNLLAREHYPHGQTDRPYTRYFIPMCTDGSTPPKGTTVCPDGQPIIQCTDGTRPAFYYKPPAAERGASDRWIIKVQSGGSACRADCWEDEDRSAFTSAWAGTAATRTATGLYKPFDSWPFASYNRIIIDKCVGDRNCGSNTIPVTNFYADDGTPKGQGPIYFHGYRELEALVAYLTVWDEPNTLTPTSQISFAAHSNGSNGMYMYIDRLADFIRHDPADGQPGLGLTGADVRGLASGYVRPSVEVENLVNNPLRDIFYWNSYAWPDFDDHITAPFSTGLPDSANGLWYSSLVYRDGYEFRVSRNWGGLLFDTGTPTSIDQVVGVNTLDESCFHEHGLNGGPGDNVEACLDSMHVLMNHVTTPIFLAPQLYDPAIKDTGLLSYTRITDSFFDLGYTPDPGSLCGSHDENFACTEQASCPDDMPCDMLQTKDAVYDNIDFALRVRAVARGAVDRSTGSPEESPADVPAPVGHAVFAPEWASHDSFEKPQKMDYQICDDDGSGNCAWLSAPLWAALKSWLEYDATVICVERDTAGIDPNRPLTSWSETTPGPLLDTRCGVRSD